MISIIFGSIFFLRKSKNFIYNTYNMIYDTNNKYKYIFRLINTKQIIKCDVFQII